MRDKDGTYLDEQAIEAYLDDLARRGRGAGTIQAYRSKLNSLLGALPEGGRSPASRWRTGGRAWPRPAIPPAR